MKFENHFTMLQMFWHTRSISKEDVVYSRQFYGNWRTFQTCTLFSDLLCWLSPILISPYRLFPSVPRCTCWPLYQSGQLCNFTSLAFWSDNVQMIPEVPHDKNIFCWWSTGGTDCSNDDKWPCIRITLVKDQLVGNKFGYRSITILMHFKLPYWCRQIRHDGVVLRWSGSQND